MESRTFLAAATFRGFSNATLRRSTTLSSLRISLASRAKTVQSRPPEKRMAISAPFRDALLDLKVSGGVLRRKIIESVRTFNNFETAGVDAIKSGTAV